MDTLTDTLDNVEERARKLVSQIQADVGERGGLVKNKRTWGSGHGPEYDAPRSTALDVLYPQAISTTPIDKIGVIVDELFNVTQLLSVNKIAPPNNLHWIQISTYDEFKEFLDKRGVPAYLSFGSQLKPPPQPRGLGRVKDGVDCAKLLCEVCTDKGLTKLPQFEVHTPLLTKKEKIEMILLDYRPKKKV